MASAFGAARAEPRKVGSGPAAFPATTTADIQPFKWDTNCFYRRLGLTPDCDRVEIARAFGELDPMKLSDTEYLYFATAAKVLLKKSSRLAYDRTPLGCFWMDDPALQAAILRMKLENTEPTDRDEWAIYADPEVTDEQARAFDSAWRSAIAAEVARQTRSWDSPPAVGIGVAVAARTARWAQIGYAPVCFISLDETLTERYVRRVVDVLMCSIEVRKVSY